MLTILVLVFSILPRVIATSCPAGGIYDSNFNKCYIYYKQPAIFLAAESSCRSIGGNLAEIRNGFENLFVAEVVSMFNNGTVSPPPYWIGANLLMSSKWTWTTNDTAVYTNWAADQPSDPSSFQCASVRDDSNLWNKELCSSARPFVCTANSIPDPVATACDPGYTQYQTQCFKLFNHFNSPLNYYDSSAFCQVHENGTLSKIASLPVQDFLYSMVFNGGQDVWIGLGCWNTGATSCWWWDGTQPTYTNYSPACPRAGETLLMMHSNGQWYSDFEFRPLSTAVICEKPARNV